MTGRQLETRTHVSGVLCSVLRAPPLVGNEPWNWVIRVKSQFKAWMVSKFTEHSVKDGEAFNSAVAGLSHH